MNISILDTDIYKFSTSYAYMKLFPNASGVFSFIDRDDTKYSVSFVMKLKARIYELSLLRLTDYERDYMINHCQYIPQHYWEWLQSFRFDADKVDIWLDDEQHLHIQVTDYLYKATLYEVPILAIVSELRNEANIPKNLIQNLKEKIDLANENGIKFSEFGTRRRFSFDVQEEVINYIKSNSNTCTGTSNCYFAMQYNMSMMGTHPHEWFMFHGAMYGYEQANYVALEDWVKVYDGDLGTALTDTYTSDVFFSNISLKQAKLFDSLRQDSGDEYEFIDKAITMYKYFRIDPLTKTIVFSNALTFPKCVEINNACKGRINASFGIGTNLTNDCGHKPANIVMKLIYCRMTDNQDYVNCVKLSDDEGKHTGRDEDVEMCIKILGL
jgi:nicotinate phosphoribosyltransferase